jgi:hypothetical protein
MPLWFKKLFLRPPQSSYSMDDGHDPQWAEFNLPADIASQCAHAAGAERAHDQPHA